MRAFVDRDASMRTHLALGSLGLCLRMGSLLLTAFDALMVDLAVALCPADGTGDWEGVLPVEARSVAEDMVWERRRGLVAQGSQVEEAKKHDVVGCMQQGCRIAKGRGW
jgi:hypothetical protein